MEWAELVSMATVQHGERVSEWKRKEERKEVTKDKDKKETSIWSKGEEETLYFPSCICTLNVNIWSFCTMKKKIHRKIKTTTRWWSLQDRYCLLIGWLFFSRNSCGQWLVFVATVKNSTVKSSCWTTRKSHWSQSKEWKLVWISVYSTGLVSCLTVGKSTVRYQMWTAGHVVMMHFKLQPSPVMICHLFSTKWDPNFVLHTCLFLFCCRSRVTTWNVFL